MLHKNLLDHGCSHSLLHLQPFAAVAAATIAAVLEPYGPSSISIVLLRPNSQAPVLLHPWLTMLQCSRHWNKHLCSASEAGLL